MRARLLGASAAVLLLLSLGVVAVERLDVEFLEPVQERLTALGPDPDETATTTDGGEEVEAGEEETGLELGEEAAEPDGPSFSSPRVATYEYSTTGTIQTETGARPLPQVTTLRVGEPTTGGTQSWIRDLRDDDGVGRMTVHDYVLTADALRLAGLTVSTRQPSSPAATRSFIGTVPGLVITPDDVPVTARSFRLGSRDDTVSVALEVRPLEVLEVAGELVEAVPIVQEITYRGRLRGVESVTSWVRPHDLLPVQEIVHSSVNLSGERTVIEYIAQLTQLPRS